MHAEYERRPLNTNRLLFPQTHKEWLVENGGKVPHNGGEVHALSVNTLRGKYPTCPIFVFRREMILDGCAGSCVCVSPLFNGVSLLQTLCFDCTAKKKQLKKWKKTQNNPSAPAAQGLCPRACLHHTWNLNAGRRRRRACHFIMLSRHGGIMTDECHSGTEAANKQAFWQSGTPNWDGLMTLCSSSSLFLCFCFPPLAAPSGRALHTGRGVQTVARGKRRRWTYQSKYR